MNITTRYIKILHIFKKKKTMIFINSLHIYFILLQSIPKSN